MLLGSDIIREQCGGEPGWIRVVSGIPGPKHHPDPADLITFSQKLVNLEGSVPTVSVLSQIPKRPIAEWLKIEIFVLLCTCVTMYDRLYEVELHA